MIKRSIFTAGAFALILNSTLQAEEVEIQLKFEPGKEYLTETQVKQSSAMPMGGQKIESAVDMTMVSSQKVTKVEKGLEVVQTMTSMKMSMNAGGMAMQFDSANPEGPMAAMIAPMLDAKSTMILDEKGEVVSVEAEAAAGMENMGMGEEEVKQAAREVVDMMPNKLVEVGESWKASSKFPTGGMTAEPVTIDYTLTLDSMVEQEGQKLAKILVKGAIDEDDGNLQVTSKELSGVMLFDPKIGQARETRMIIDIEIGLPEGVEAAEGAPGTMPMRMVSHSKLKSIK